MAPKDPLDAFRRRAYRHALEGGIGDIVVGFYTLTVACATQNRGLIALAAAYLFLYATSWQFLHQALSSRRIGYAELPEQPPKLLLAGTLASMLLTMIVVAAITWSSGKLWNVGHWPKKTWLARKTLEIARVMAATVAPKRVNSREVIRVPARREPARSSPSMASRRTTPGSRSSR